jgi:tetratricopeptide (TPR) repeat protein
MRYIVMLMLLLPLMLGCTKKIEPSSTYPVAEEGKANDAMKISLGEKPEGDAKSDSDSSEIMKLLIEGSNAHNAGRYPAAIDVFKKIIELDSNHIDAWMRMGSSYRGAGERQEGIRCFRKATEIDTENGLALYD